MTTKELQAIKTLIKKGAVDCARVVSSDFGKSEKWFNKLVETVKREN